MATHLKHQSLGEVHGKDGDGVVQYLGIKYATVKDRFALSQLFDPSSTNGIIDGTKLGYVTLFLTHSKVY